MKKLLLTLIILAVMALAPALVRAETIGFDMGILSFNSSERTAQNGTGNFLTIKFPVDSATSIGFYNERLSFNLKGNKNAANIPSVIGVDVDINGIQITRQIVDKVDVGFNLAMADVSGFWGAVQQFADTVPMVDVFAKWVILGGGDKVKSQLNAALGYRLLSTTPVTPAAGPGDFVKEINNLGGFWLSLAIGIAF